MAKYVGELEETCLALWRKRVRRFGEKIFGDFGENVFGDLEKKYSAILARLVRRKHWRFGET